MKLSKYARSQRAHSKLVDVNHRKASMASLDMKKRIYYYNVRNYHAEVYNVQQREHRVLSRTQRAKIYKDFCK